MTSKFEMSAMGPIKFFLGLQVDQSAEGIFIHQTKYVDDILAIVKSNEVEEILKALNDYHDKLQFTVEQEEDGSIPYLDMKIYSKDNKIITNWYCKPTASGRIINYHSTQPHNQKINTAYNLINKVLTIIHEQFIIENIKKLKTILKSNDYPLYIIKNLCN